MSTFVNQYPAETFYRLLQFGWSGNSGVSTQPVYIQDGTGGNTALLVDNKNLSVGLPSTSIDIREYCVSVGQSNQQDGANNLQAGSFLKQIADNSFQFGASNLQKGFYNFQAGSYNSQSGFGNFQCGYHLNDSGYSYTYMFGNFKTSTISSRAYFSLDNGIWLNPGSNPPILESGCIWFNSVSGWCAYVSGQARRFAFY